MENNPSNITLRQAADFLLSHDDFLILSHANPDGDTFGCSHGLCRALQKIGKRAKIKCADPLPANFSHLAKAVDIQDFEEKTIVSVDVADKTLLGKLEEIYGDKIELAIDHHLSHVPFAQRIYVEPNAAACAEIILDLVKMIGAQLDEKLASCLYTGIATDTGCFKFGNTTPDTHMKAAELMKYDFGCADLNYILFDMKTPQRLKLEQYALNATELFAGGKGAVVVLPANILAQADAEDINGISSLPRQIQGVEIGIVIKEKEGAWKVSMRSNHINVQELCGKFGGGGHEKAAGCTIKNVSGEEAKELTVAAATEAIRAWTE